MIVLPAKEAVGRLGGNHLVRKRVGMSHKPDGMINFNYCFIAL